MGTSRTVVIDCGASRTALGVFSRQGRRIRLDHCAVENFPLRAGSEDHWLENTRAALAVLRKSVKSGGPVVLVLPAHLVLAKLIKVPRAAPAQREKIIRFEAAQKIPYALTEVVWSSAVVGETDLELEVLLAAAKHDSVELLCAAAQAAGFQPRVVLASSFGTLAGFRLARPARQEPSLVLNLGARFTTLLLVDAHRLAVRTFSVGGNRVTQQIAENQDCDLDEAEAIKLSERNAHLTVDAMDTLRTRLAQEITRSVLHFQWKSGLGNSWRIFLTGGGAPLPGLADALAETLKVPTECFDPLGVVEPAAGSAPPNVSPSALTDLVGAAATQLLPGQLGLNLLPPERLHRENLRRRRPWLIAAAVLAVSAMLPPVAHFRNVADEARKKSAAIEHELGPLRDRDALNRENLRRLEECRERIGRLQAIADRRASWLSLLADLEERLGRIEDAWFEKLQIVPVATGAPLKLAVSGRLLDRANPLAKGSAANFSRVKDLLASMARSPFVASVEGERFDSDQPGILRFDFVLVANPQRPL